MQEGTHGQAAPGKSKLDNLSKDDLIRFVKKQVDNAREMKTEMQSLRDKMEVQNNEISSLHEANGQLGTENSSLSRKLEEYQIKHDFLQQTIVLEKPDASADELLLKARVIELEKSVKDLTDEVSSHCDEKLLLTQQLNAVKTELSDLTSALDDSRAELSALKESRSTADVFSLELADYEKKVDRLEHDLKECNKRSEAQAIDITKMTEQLDSKNAAENKLTLERDSLKEENEKIEKQLKEEKVISAKSLSELQDLQDKLQSLQEDRGSERVGLGKELSACQHRIIILEEAVDALKSENDGLCSLKDEAERKLISLQDDYDNFKSRAKFVLEQKAKSDESGNQSDRIEELENSLSLLKGEENQLRVENTSLRLDINTIREKLSRRENESNRYKNEVEQLQLSLSSLMDDLRNSRVLLEKRNTELTESKSRVLSLDHLSKEAFSVKEKLEEQISVERTVSTQQIQSLKDELTLERKTKDELRIQLDESRHEPRISRPPPIAAVFPQLSERGLSSSDILKEESKLQDDITQYDRSLEDVLFGEDYFTGTVYVDSPKSAEELIVELNETRIHAQNTRELLSETEATNARLLEQGTLLKEEIRRLQRNEERTEHLENVEYLKNVILKFLSPQQVSSEKAQLIPILNTMLRLSSDELQVLQRAAQTDNCEESSPSWSSYIRWGGLS